MEQELVPGSWGHWVSWGGAESSPLSGLVLGQEVPAGQVGEAGWVRQEGFGDTSEAERQGPERGALRVSILRTGHSGSWGDILVLWGRGSHLARQSGGIREPWVPCNMVLSDLGFTAPRRIVSLKGQWVG